MRWFLILDKGFISFIKENKRLVRIAALIAIGVILIFISSAFGSEKKDTDKAMSLDEYREELESRLESLCHSVDGVGRCRVFVTLERGEQNTYKGSVVIETKPPKVLGVTVVCAGADSDYVKSQLVDMCVALFGIGSNRVAVLKLNS